MRPTTATQSAYTPAPPPQGADPHPSATTPTTACRRRCKALIVGLAYRELLPRRLADWLIRRGELRHD